MTKADEIGVWFVAIRAHTGADVFTERLAKALRERGVKAEISWLPHYAEYLPWLVKKPHPPAWATVAHVNSWLHESLLPDNLPRVVTVHLCVHDQSIGAYQGFLQKLYHRVWIRHCESLSLKSADAVTAVSHYTAKMTKRIFETSEIRVIHNWVDSKSLPLCGVQAPGKSKPFRLVFVGNVTQRKGADLLVPIMEKLSNGFELRYTGTEDDLRKIGVSKIPKNVIPVGRISSQTEMEKLYGESDALIFPTRLEGFGLVVAEAMAAGLAVVASNCSSIPELIGSEGAGILCTPDNVEEFVGACKRLHSSPGIRQMISVKARDRAERLFSPAEAVGKYVRVYQDVTNDA
ncbi:glycosyltransferase family 4 protein [Marinobacter sp. NP-4(2019)]|uniref:glycosyltransferase family 4 protein n=1 Tax=Marinobacter sp. NP-4(2019) TaxID=2488665 RepID=UPI0013E07141|nr:glycosyltransferase family 4 protein [Marinobacter sp. NP-4(2019)]